MYAAIGGLKSHMQKLNVIGNNIANVNTYGYKAGRTVFQTSLYTNLSSGSNGTAVVGGRNPSQIGYGVSVGSVDIDMSTGTYNPTGWGLDCMISGDGFFLVGDKTIADVIDPANAESLKALTLTRVGDFEFGPDGYLVDGKGNVVYGFLSIADPVENPDGSTIPVISDQLVPIRYPGYDADKMTIMYPTEGNAADKDDKTLQDATYEDPDTKEQVAYPFAQFDSVSIDGTTGKITGVCKDTDEVITIGFIALGNVTSPNGVTQESDTYYKCGEGAGALSVSLMGGAQENVQVNGTLGLDYINASLLADDVESAEGMKVYSAGTTKLITGGLEMSKTDLATEISEMITTQRGYQANTRIITVTDSMLEELVNMKR